MHLHGSAYVFVVDHGVDALGMRFRLGLRGGERVQCRCRGRVARLRLKIGMRFKCTFLVIDERTRLEVGELAEVWEGWLFYANLRIWGREY